LECPLLLFSSIPFDSFYLDAMVSVTVSSIGASLVVDTGASIALTRDLTVSQNLTLSSSALNLDTHSLGVSGI